MNTKLKGDLGELKVASDLVSQGYTISIPFGDNSAYDLILDKNNLSAFSSCSCVEISYG